MVLSKSEGAGAETATEVKKVNVGVAMDNVAVHPLVLLSVVDHYNRVAKDTKKRCLGVVLGERRKGRVEATNSFALPFEEDEKNPQIWFLDHSYLENMYRMFKKVNGWSHAWCIRSFEIISSAESIVFTDLCMIDAAREKVIGWYHTGPRLRESDMDIHKLITQYCENNTGILVICEVKPKDVGLPVQAYRAVEEVREDGTDHSKMVFMNLPTEVGSTEAEEIGVEHLLRDVKDATVSNLSSQLGEMMTGLKGLRMRLLEIQSYLEAVVSGKLPVNNDIIKNLQDIFSLLPNLNMEEMVSSFAVETNDMMMAVYLASLVRSVVALHNLIENKESRMSKNQENGAVLESEKASDKTDKSSK